MIIGFPVDMMGKLKEAFFDATVDCGGFESHGSRKMLTIFGNSFFPI